MLELLEKQTRLTGNQRRLLTVAILCDMLEFYDFFVVGYVLAFIVGPWKVTYGQSAVILLSSGLGAILGAGLWGWLADRIGRRRVLIITVINFSVASGILAFTPDRGWIFLSVFRFVVGVGVGGLYSVIVPLVQEFVPSGKRGLVSGIVTAAIPVGLALGAVLGAYLGPIIGWRGLFAVGSLPVLMVLLIRAWMPESPRWLVQAGRLEEARRSLGWALEVDPAQISLPAPHAAPPQAKWRELFHYPRSLAVSGLANLSGQTAIYGLTLWVPTLFVLLIGIKPAQAAYLMIYCSAGAFAGRVTFAWLSDAIGRRMSGGLYGFGGAALVILAGYLHSTFVGTVSLFWLILIPAYFFVDGGFAILGPYAAEVWPARLRATGMGAAYGFGGIGKIIGPLGLALISGSSNVINPAASIAKVIPAFLYLGTWCALTGIVLGFFGMETRGRSIEQIDGELSRGHATSP
jgi:MFS transporter, putative metabolite:H+ symporter